jgi:hypothetical protein
MKLKRRVSKYMFYHVSTDGTKSSHSIERKKEDIRDQDAGEEPRFKSQKSMYPRKNKMLTFADNNLFAPHTEQTYLDQVNLYLVNYIWKRHLVTTSILS